MSNIIKQPLLNPVKFVSMLPTAIPQYISKHMDDWLFLETIKPWEQHKSFKKVWLKDDSIRLQYTSNFGTITLKLFSCNGIEVYSAPFENRQQDLLNPGYYIRQIELDLDTFDAGVYYLTVPEVDWISDPFIIADEDDETNPTQYIEYSNSEFYGGIIFDSPFTPAIRLPSILKYKHPASLDTVYPDQDQAETMLHSIQYRVWSFILGGVGGVPPYLIDKVSRIFGCDSLKIDGRLFTKNEGSNWEPVEIEGYPMAGWSIELREKLNRDSLIYDTDVQIIDKAAMMLIMDSKGFGISDSGSDFLEVVDVE